MGRPSLAEARTVEILDAFERCVGRFGLEGSSLERIAEEAGMRRSILRHYVGNRDDLIHLLCDRVVHNYQADLDHFIESINPEKRIDQLVGYLLPTQPRESIGKVVVVESLIAAGEHHPPVRLQMSGYINHFVKQIAEQLQLEFPKRSSRECWQVAYGTVCICFNQASLVSLELPRRYDHASRECVRRLINSLRG